MSAHLSVNFLPGLNLRYLTRLTGAIPIRELTLLQRLGHENLLTKRSSVRYAEKVALKKVDNQPDKPERLTADDVARVTGAPGMAM